MDKEEKIDLSKPPKDLDQELEILPNMIAYIESQMETFEVEIGLEKANKEKLIAECMLKFQNEKYTLREAMCKKVSADENVKITKLKGELGKCKVEFNRLKNRFQSVRKLASLRMEEMRSFK